VLNVVHVSSEEQESNYLNNTAAALVRITADPKDVAARAVRAAALSRACNTLVASPRVLQSGGTSIVLTTARNRFGRPIRGLLVRVSGLGLDQRARTDARGIARFSVTPAQHGIVHFQHAARLPAGVRSSCGTVLAVLGTTIQRPVTG
jgi:hypothetical protein